MEYAADDFAHIAKRMEELRKEKEAADGQVIETPPAAQIPQDYMGCLLRAQQLSYQQSAIYATRDARLTEALHYAAQRLDATMRGQI